jgi:hypothetical protein
MPDKHLYIGVFRIKIEIKGGKLMAIAGKKKAPFDVTAS